MSDKKNWPVMPLGLIVIGAGIAGLYLAGISADVFFSFWPDQTSYLVFGLGISHGDGLCNVALDPCEPFNVMHPPGMALLIAAVIRVFGMHIPAIKLVLITMFLVGLVLYADLTRRRGDGRLGPMAAALTAASPFALAFSQVIMADFPYVGLSLAALWALGRWEKAGRMGWLIAGIGLATGCYYLRPIGLAVILALMAGVLLAARPGGPRQLSRRGQAAILLVLLLGLSSWFIILTVRSGYSGWQLFLDEMTAKKIGHDYVSNTIQPGTALKIRGIGLVTYISVASQFLLPWSWAQAWSWLPGLAAAGLAAAGWVRCWRRHRSGLEAYPVFYGLVLLLWAHPEERYLFSLFPLLMFYMLKGIEGLAARVGPRLARALPMGTGLAVLAAMLSLDLAVVMDLAPGAPSRFRLRPQTARPWLEPKAPLQGLSISPHFRMLPSNAAGLDMIRLLLWARDHLPPASRIFVNFPNDGYLISGLRNPVFFENQPDPLAEFIRGQVDYVMIGEAFPGYSNWAMKAITREPGSFEEIIRIPGTRTVLYRFRPPG
jgi:hypothetical protein